MQVIRGSNAPNCQNLVEIVDTIIVDHISILTELK